MIKLLVPNVPTIDEAMQYLRRIDESRHYTNFGANVVELEQRLQGILAPDSHVVTVSSCTAGLELAYTMYKAMGMDSIYLSAFTFPATALAAHRAGLLVELRDPDPQTWTDGTVSAFGAPVTGRPIIDAAGAIGEQTCPPESIVVFSLHATKPLPAGEGGFIVTHDSGEAAEFRAMTNFGFLAAERINKYQLGFGVARGMGTNAKLSEYHAAIALAALDQWTATREAYLTLFDWYALYLPGDVVVQRRPRGVYPSLAVLLPEGVNARVAAVGMLVYGVETRRWYCPPLYRHPLFAADPANFPVSEMLNDRLLGLPWHLHLTKNDVMEVCKKLQQTINVIRK